MPGRYSCFKYVTVIRQVLHKPPCLFMYPSSSTLCCVVEHSVQLIKDVTTKLFIMSNKSSDDTASRKVNTAVFGYGIHMDLLSISDMWLTVMSFFLASEEHGVQRISPQGLTLRLLMSYIYMERLFLMFLGHTQRRSTVGRTPLDE